jgi:hypothetical protein
MTNRLSIAAFPLRPACLLVPLLWVGLHAGENPAVVNLGSAENFAVLAGSGITVAGSVGSTLIIGDIGSYPTPAETGLENVVLIGTDQGGDAVTQLAKSDLLGAFDDAAGRSSDETLSELGGLDLDAGVYTASSSLDLTGVLTLDGQDNSNAVFIFQVGSALTTASYSSVALINGAQANNIFWEIGSSATLGSYSDFDGNILAADSITLGTYATVNGRLLALTGAVTIDGHDSITEIVSASDAGMATLLLGLVSFGSLFGLRASGNFRLCPAPAA